MADQTPNNNQPPAGGGGLAPWYPTEQADYVSNKGWKGPGELLESYVNLEKVMGADRAGRTLVMPKDDQDVEGMKAFRAKLGVPESADKYEIQVPDNDSGEFLKAAAGWFHELGIPKAAAQGLAAKWNDYWGNAAKSMDAELQANSAKELDGLKLEWGGDFEKKSAFAKDFLKQSGWSEQDVADYEKARGTGRMLKDFYSWGSKVQEPGFAGDPSKGGGGGGGVTKEVAKQKYTEIVQQRISGQITDSQWRDSKKEEYERYFQIASGA